MGKASTETSSTDHFTYVQTMPSNYLTPRESASNRAPISPATPPPPSPATTATTTSDFRLPPLPPLPKIIWHTDPDVKLKLRKRFYPLGVTRLTLGADLDVKTRAVSFKWSWKDRFIGGRLHFEANQISLTKRFDIDSRTKLDFRAAFDVESRRTLFSVNVKPFRGIVAHDRPPSGLTFKQKIPIDRHVAVEAHGRIAVPEARFSNETTSAVSLGEGDFVVDLDQLNFRFMLQ